jgi:SAM-dependent methyltransferase
MSASQLHNRTRQTQDLPAKFRRENRWDLLLFYRLLQSSFLASEGIKNSGSFRFADHLYRNVPGGDGVTGRLLDRLLLNLPAAGTMRRRYLRSKMEMLSAFEKAASPIGDFYLLTVPCGIPRDAADFIEAVQKSRTPSARSIQYYGMDLDPGALEAATKHLVSRGIDPFRLTRGDALEPEDYPPIRFDFVASTGLGEFLSDSQLKTFYGNVHQVLRPGGIFYTSALDREPISDWLMKPFELRVQYRSQAELSRILAEQPWDEVEIRSSKRQTYLVLRKPR